MSSYQSFLKNKIKLAEKKDGIKHLKSAELKQATTLTLF